MKKVFYFLPILTLLVFTSCEKEETSEIVNENLETNSFKIETIENDNGKIFTLASGLYGPNETLPDITVTYTLVVPPTILNKVQRGKGTYHLDIYYEKPGSSGWEPVLSMDRPSNGTAIIFPAEYEGQKRNKWLIAYGVYGTGLSPWFQYKEVVINH